MSVEQTARDFITKMNKPDQIRGYLTPDAMVSGGVLPQAMPATEAIKILGGLSTAMPDLRFDIQKVTVNGNQATVNAKWTGTQSAPLSLPMPGMSPIAPTGRKVSVTDRYIVTVKDDKVSDLRIDSPSDGGIPAALAQLGVKTPGM